MAKRDAAAPLPPKGPPGPGNTTGFGPPVIAPDVRDPAAVKYAREVAARHPPKYTEPVAGGPTPPIPRLDAVADPGLTMADQANIQRAGAEGPPQQQQAPAPRRGPMFQPNAPPVMPQAPGLVRPPKDILPIDVLPNEARQDPEFKEGSGSMYASAQPNLAYKYGVIRNGKLVPPQALGQGPAKGATKMTKEDWDNLASFQQTKAKAEGEDTRIEQEAAQGVAGAAGRLGNAPSDGPQADPSATSKNISEAVKKLDDFDFNTFREMMMKDIINNEEQRAIIEKRCKPLDITDLIMKGFVTQRVPVIPEKFEPEFQSMTGT